MARGINLTFRGNDEGARAQAEAVAKALDQLGVSADAVKFNFQNSQKGADSLFGSLKELRGEARQHERVFAYYGAQLASLTGTSRETATALAGLGIALSSGMWIAGAVEGIKLLVEQFKASAEEEKKAREEAEKHSKAIRDLHFQTDEYLASLEGASHSQLALMKAQHEYDETTRKDRERIAEINRELAKTDEELESGWKQWRSAILIRKNLTDEQAAATERLAKAQETLTAARTEGGRMQEGEDAKLARDEAKKANDQREKDELDHNKRMDAAVKARVEEELQAERDYSEGLAKIQLARAAKAKEIADAMAAAEIAAANKKFEADYAAEERAEKKRIDDLAASTKQYAKAVGDLALRWAEGQVTAKQALMGIMKMVLEKLIEIGATELAARVAQHAAQTPIKIADVISSAGVAGANAAAQVAATPAFATAPEVGAGIAEAITTSMTPLASAAGGYYRIPFDRPVYTHRDEQILPAEYAEGLRRLIENGGGGGGITVNVGGMIDGRNMERALTANDGPVARAERKRARRRRS